VARVLLYTRSECAYSLDLRTHLVAGEDVVEEVNLTEEPQAMTEFLKLTDGRRIVPVVVRGAVITIAPDGGTEF
jgi:glutaredoxin